MLSAVHVCGHMYFFGFLFLTRFSVFFRCFFWPSGNLLKRNFDYVYAMTHFKIIKIGPPLLADFALLPIQHRSQIEPKSILMPTWSELNSIQHELNCTDLNWTRQSNWSNLHAMRHPRNHEFLGRPPQKKHHDVLAIAAPCLLMEFKSRLVMEGVTRIHTQVMTHKYY